MPLMVSLQGLTRPPLAAWERREQQPRTSPLSAVLQPSRITGEEPASASASRGSELTIQTGSSERVLSLGALAAGLTCAYQSAPRAASGGHGTPTSTGTPLAAPERLQVRTETRTRALTLW